jgi:thiol-disulfide isomerase/thioredoxin
MILLLGTSLALLGGCDKQSAPAPQAKDQLVASVAPAEPVQPESSGTLDISHRGEAMPQVAFEAPNGDQVTLGDFRGRPLLVNLWATWCGPCKAELGSLDKLAVRQANGLQVLVVSQDKDHKTAADYLAGRKFSLLQPYLDARLTLGEAFATGMVPTTVLYDKSGKEIWRVVGAMDWDGPRANTLMAEALAG